MASSPSFTASACVGRAAFSAVNTARDGTGTLQSLTWVGSGGAGAPTTDWMLKRIQITQTGDLADCMVTAFTTDAAGANPILWWDFDLGNPSASSTTVGGAGVSGTSGPALDAMFNDINFAAGQDIKFTLTVAPTSGLVVVHVFGERV